MPSITAVTTLQITIFCLASSISKMYLSTSIFVATLKLFLVTFQLIGSSFQTTSICSWNYKSQHQIIRSVTVTPDNKLVILEHDDNAYEVPLSGLNTTSHRLTISEQHSAPSKWYQLDSMKLSKPDASLGSGTSEFKLTRFDAIPPPCSQKDGGFLHYQFRNQLDVKREVNLGWTSRQKVESHFVQEEPYSLVVDSASKHCQAYAFVQLIKGKVVMLIDFDDFIDNKISEKFSAEHAFRLELTRTKITIFKGFDKASDNQAPTRKPPAKLPVGFIHDSLVYLWDLDQELVSIFHYYALDNLKGNDKTKHFTEELVASVPFTDFFHCPEESGQDGDGIDGTVSMVPKWTVQNMAIVGGAILLSLLLLALAIALCNCIHQSSAHKLKHRSKLMMMATSTCTSDTIQSRSTFTRNKYSPAHRRISPATSKQMNKKKGGKRKF